LWYSRGRLHIKSNYIDIDMKILIGTSMATGFLIVGAVIYMIWFEAGDILAKLLVTLSILFVVQIIAYLMMRDIQEESSGKEDGTIAR